MDNKTHNTRTSTARQVWSVMVDERQIRAVEFNDLDGTKPRLLFEQHGEDYLGGERWTRVDPDGALLLKMLAIAIDELGQ